MQVALQFSYLKSTNTYRCAKLGESHRNRNGHQYMLMHILRVHSDGALEQEGWPAFSASKAVFRETGASLPQGHVHDIMPC